MNFKIITILPVLSVLAAFTAGPAFSAGAKIVEETKTIGPAAIRIQIPVSSAREEISAREAIGKAFKEASGLNAAANVSTGQIIDKEVAVLKDNGILNALINSDAQIYSLGQKSAGEMWKAWIPDPARKNKKVFAILRLKDKAVVTVRNNTISASVVADTAGDAERLAKELLAQGPNGLKTAQDLGLDALLLIKEGNKFKTGMAGGFKEQYGKTGNR
ncbi:MAG: FAD:protein FMN transferase [Candidatus Omnitrophota bacterium]|nr:FAD:protein FMN transferase [Candidatus Omnitrophota bacterium]